MVESRGEVLNELDRSAKRWQSTSIDPLSSPSLTLLVSQSAIPVRLASFRVGQN